MGTFFWIWVASGCLAALFNMWATKTAHKAGAITDEDLAVLDKQVPYIILGGVLSVLYLLYLLFTPGDEE